MKGFRGWKVEVDKRKPRSRAIQILQQGLIRVRERKSEGEGRADLGIRGLGLRGYR